MKTVFINAKAWSPKPSKRLAVISPFISATALHSLAATTQEVVVLVSRPDELARASKASQKARATTSNARRCEHRHTDLER